MAVKVLFHVLAPTRVQLDAVRIQAVQVSGGVHDVPPLGVRARARHGRRDAKDQAVPVRDADGPAAAHHGRPDQVLQEAPGARQCARPPFTSPTRRALQWLTILTSQLFFWIGLMAGFPMLAVAYVSSSPSDAPPTALAT